MYPMGNKLAKKSGHRIYPLPLLWHAGVAVLEVTTVQERPNGPLYARGRLQIRRRDGSVREETQVAQCRCGQSANKPFCDGTHRRIGFRTLSPIEPVQST